MSSANDIRQQTANNLLIPMCLAKKLTSVKNLTVYNYTVKR